MPEPEKPAPSQDDPALKPEDTTIRDKIKRNLDRGREPLSAEEESDPDLLDFARRISGGNQKNGPPHK